VSSLREYLDALKADLVDRRMLPVLLTLGVLLVAAVVYVVVGGGEKAQTPIFATAPTSSPSGATGISITPVAKGTTGAVAEVTSGESLQHSGPTRDPLQAPPGSKRSSTAASAVKGSSAPGKTSGSSSPAATSPAAAPKTTTATTTSATTTATSTSATAVAPSAPATPASPYAVDVEFGEVPAGTTTAVAGLAAHLGLTRITAFPSAADDLVALTAISDRGKAARFVFVKPMIPTGVAKCIPSPSQCEAVDLKPGQVEELEYLPSGGGPAIFFQIHLLGISKT
jgi:hypothetical protein